MKNDDLSQLSFEELSEIAKKEEENTVCLRKILLETNDFIGSNGRLRKSCSDKETGADILKIIERFHNIFITDDIESNPKSKLSNSELASKISKVKAKYDRLKQRLDLGTSFLKLEMEEKLKIMTEKAENVQNEILELENKIVLEKSRRKEKMESHINKHKDIFSNLLIELQGMNSQVSEAMGKKAKFLSDIDCLNESIRFLQNNGNYLFEFSKAE